jgi:hypothetical protein
MTKTFSAEMEICEMGQAPGVAGHALQEEEALLLVEDRVRRSARVARHVLLDVAAKHVLDVLLLEPATNVDRCRDFKNIISCFKRLKCYLNY